MSESNPEATEHYELTSEELRDLLHVVGRIALEDPITTLKNDADLELIRRLTARWGSTMEALRAYDAPEGRDGRD
jgi:hypothetical protein